MVKRLTIGYKLLTIDYFFLFFRFKNAYAARPPPNSVIVAGSGVWPELAFIGESPPELLDDPPANVDPKKPDIPPPEPLQPVSISIASMQVVSSANVNFFIVSPYFVLASTGSCCA